MHVILTGATGQVGSGVLAHMLSLPASQLTRLSILSRKPVPLAEEANKPNVKVILHDDFANYPPELLEELNGAHGVVWALGVSQADVTEEDYIRVTKDYPLTAARAFSELSDKFNFVYVSGEGATLRPGMFTPLFGRVKGETEAALLEMSKNIPSLNVYSLRPGAVDHTKHAEIVKHVAARRTGLKFKIGDNVLLPVVRTCFPNMHSPTRELGKVLTELAMGDGKPLRGPGVEGEGRTITNVGQRRLAGL